MTMTIVPVLREAGVVCFTRSEWDSVQEARGSYAKRVSTHPMPPGPAPYHFLHITVTEDTDVPVDGKEAAQLIETFGWSTPPMVSYQDLVTNEGLYFQGQNYKVKGTHTINDRGIAGFAKDLNLYGYATALMQNVWDEVTDIQVQVVAMVFAARELLGLVARGAPVFPHRNFANKSCPGDLAVARIDEIVALKNKYVQAGRLPGINEEDEVVTPEEIAKIAEAVKVSFLKADIGDGKGGKRTVKTAIRMASKAPEVARQLEDVIASHIVHAASGDLDPDMVRRAVKDGITEVLREGVGDEE